MSVPSSRVARDPSASVRLPYRQLYFGAVPLEMFTNPNISDTCIRVFAHTFLVHEEFGAKESRRSAMWVAKMAGYCDRTVRDCWDLLEREGFMERYREGTKWVSRITYELPPRLGLDDTIPVYKGSRRGDKTSTHPAPLAEPPRPIPKSASKRIRGSGCKRIPGSGPGASNRIQGSGSGRNPGSAPSIETSLSLEKTTTTTLDPAQRERPAPVGSSSFLPFVEENPGPLEPASPPEALGSPQDAPGSEEAETYDPDAERPSWEALAVSKMAKAWPDATTRHYNWWLKSTRKLWRREYRGEDGQVPSDEECARVAALAVEYSALMKCDPRKVWVYMEHPLNQWAINGWDSSDIESEVDQWRPRPPKVAARVGPVEPPPRPKGLDAIEAEMRSLMSVKTPEAARRRDELVAMADALLAGASESPRHGVSPDRGGGLSLNGEPSMSG